MSKRIVIAIGREFGSGGKHIGRALAKELNIPLYDRNVVEKVADELDVGAKYLQEFATKKRRSFFHRTVKGHTTSLEDHVAQMQFDYIRRLGEILRECSTCEGVITIFVKGDREYKIGRVMKQFDLSREDAIEKMERHDKTRKYYHDRYCKGKWGQVETYDLCIDSTHFGTQGTADFLYEYVKKRMAD